MAAETFIDVALRKTGPLSLSYVGKNVRWLVREHALSLVAEFPALSLSVEPFTFDNGTTVNLLKAGGLLSLPSSPSPVHLSVWIHQSYPSAAPFVYLLPPPGKPTLRHPFVDSSTGTVVTPYLLDWSYPRRRPNLSELVRNLVKIFAFWPPSSPTAEDCSKDIAPRRPSSSPPSKREAIDRLAMRLLCDVEAVGFLAWEDTDSLSTVQSALLNRAALLSSAVSDLTAEKLALKERVDRARAAAEGVSQWLTGRDMGSSPADCADEAFEAADHRSRILLDHKAAEDGIDDTMMAVDAAMSRGVLPLGAYLRQVRDLAKEQFFHRSVQMELAGEPRLYPFRSSSPPQSNNPYLTLQKEIAGA